MITKIISSGQTGVDRAALEVATKLDITHEGWWSKGRLAKNGKIPAKYSLVETNSSNYDVRTKLNVRDSDGTLILMIETQEKIKDGTILTIQEAKRIKKTFYNP